MRIKFAGTLPIQRGGGYFRGTYVQKGHGIGAFLKGLWSAILPIAKQAGKTVAKQAVRTGAHALTDFIEGDENRMAVRVKRRRRKPAKRATRIQKGGKLGSRTQKGIKRLKRKRRPVKKRRTIFD